MKWVKITTDMFENRKIRYLRRLQDGDTICLIWVMLIAVAGQCGGGGKLYLTEDIPYTEDMLADEFGYRQTMIVKAIGALERLKMIRREDGYIVITGWEEYQNTDGMDKVREQTRNRVTEYRNRRRDTERCNASVTDCNVTDVTGCNVTCNVTGNADVTHCNATEEEKRIIYTSSSSSDARARASCNVTDDGGTCGKPCGKLNAVCGSLGGGVVMLSAEQEEDLLERLSLDEFNHYVGVVRDCILKGHAYKRSHYQAILDMAEKDRRLSE